MKIPKQLQNEKFRFIKVRKGEKGAFEKDWQKEDGMNYQFDSLVFQEWLKKNNNYGVVAGFGDLIIIDADTKTVQKLIKEWLPKTFTVHSPGHNGLHFYFICSDLKAIE